MRGLRLPLEFISGRFNTVEGVDKLSQNISLIVNTEVLSRLMEPNMGSIQSEMLFRIPNSAVHGPILNKLKDAINTQEPRVRVDSITLAPQSDTDRLSGTLVLNIVYTIKNTNKTVLTEVQLG